MDTAISVKHRDVPKKWTVIEKGNPGNRTVDKMGQGMIECIRPRQKGRIQNETIPNAASFRRGAAGASVHGACNAMDGELHGKIQTDSL